ncbi:ATPase family AAA domain-containing protein 1-A isoform X2 [Thalassophryne amazonica]|uniref:ATPase family AAA domain-containing protein 1-A isoform X2 n=1 Tax=Thalassophryne amazonica TaxID=390379 RepID=UPI00147135EE|nr:ATPase family AAA domain-containing protein 1-A isoform X2 [Thalassophryne amazonica]
MLRSFLSSTGDLFQSLANHNTVDLLVWTAVVGAISYYGMKWFADAMDPTSKQKQKAKKQAEALMKKIGIEGVSLTDHEMRIAAHLIDPKSMTESWKDIPGLSDIIEELQDNVMLPIQQRDVLPESKLFQPPKGVLLCGPPGCGKTMITKAAAKASGCHFINLQPSTLMDKWHGESQKLTAAVFSLAAKIQPCIIFIDEIDSFLRNRSSQDAETIAMMKAQFLSLWDSLQTSSHVMVMGAANRPHDIDPAILWRMPTAFHIGLPNARQRQEILRLILAGENMSNAINLKEIAEQTEGYSGSDLRELCRDAAMYRVRDYVRKQQMRQIAQQLNDFEDDESPVDEERLRPVTQLDLLFGLDKLKESKLVTASAVPSLSEVPLD